MLFNPFPYEARIDDEQAVPQSGHIQVVVNPPGPKSAAHGRLSVVVWIHLREEVDTVLGWITLEDIEGSLVELL